MAGGDWAAVPTPAAVASMVADYAALQQATGGRRCQAEAAGVPVWNPADAAYELERQATVLHALPGSDPRRITSGQRELLLANRNALAVSGTALANSPIPFGIDQGDLWPGNVLIARPGGHHRFIDFGDATWTHPFLSLEQLLFFCHGRWSLPEPFDDSFGDPALRMIIDSYLRAWTDDASPRELRELLGHALRLAPLMRGRAVIANAEHATSSDTHDLGTMPWSRLTASPRTLPSEP